MKTWLLIIALAICASPAFAGTFVSTRGCNFSFSWGYGNCVFTSAYIADPIRIPEQERQDAIAQARQDEKWDTFCKPTFTADQYGVRRATYAHKGCDVGRSE